MLLLALIFYLKYEAPEDEQNFPMVMEMLRAGEVHEDDDYYQSPLDILFFKLEKEILITLRLSIIEIIIQVVQKH